MGATNVILDTGPLVAYLNRADKHHSWAVSCWEQLVEPVVTCESVISEAAFLLQQDQLDVERLWSALERGTIRVTFDFEGQKPNLLRLLRKYQDQPMSLADACMVRLSELAENSAVFTTDRDFQVYRRYGRSVIPLIAPFAP